LHYFWPLEPRSDNTARTFSLNEKAWVAFILAWVAGFSDAFGFLKLNQIFFSAVSGNTVAINASLARRDWTEMGIRGCPIIFFVVGVIFGEILEGAASRLQVRRRFSIALVFEVVLLLCFMLVGWVYLPSAGVPQASAPFYVLIALLSGAMGIQTASLRRVGHESVNTPFVTGMMVQALENAVNVLFNVYDRVRSRPATFPSDSLFKALFHGGLWFCFAVGAACGGFGEVFLEFPALLVPIGVLALVIICDIVRPIYD
jgi:uncharacterized membrane protein YoaK (UPF0700 family)